MKLQSEKIFPSLRSLIPWISGLAIICFIQIFIADEIDPYFYSLSIYAGINILLALSLNLITGFAGQFSMGHAGFMSIGAYISAFITVSLNHSYSNINNEPWLSSLVFLIALVAGAIAAAVSGYFVGLPCLRLKGDYLAIVTLGFGEIIRVFLLNLDVVGGARGLPNIPAYTHLGWVFGIVILTLLFLWRLIDSRFGRAYLSIREDEIAAEAMGVPTTRFKIQAFVISAAISGVAGGLYAHYLRYLNPQAFDFNKSFEMIIMVVLGGMGSLTGSVISAGLLTGVREALRPLQEWTHIDFRMIIYSLLLIFCMLFRPQGLLGNREISSYFRFWRKNG